MNKRREKLKNRIGIAFSALLFILSPSLAVHAKTELMADKEVKVPVVIDVPEAVAGMDFAFEYTEGLSFLGFEKSDTTESASVTPVVEREGMTHLGFYNATNDYKPDDGKLEAGYLVFHYNGDRNQYVTLVEAKYVEVVDKDNTNSAILQLNQRIDVPLDGSGATSFNLIILVVAIAILLILCITFVALKMKNKRKISGTNL